MLFTASTVKDTLPNVQRFVAGNLAGGVDHMVVFLDAADPEVRDFLDGHPHVTCVRTDKAWWRGERPADLNRRQRINANVVNAALSALALGDPAGGGDWLFHIDGDEVVQVDRTLLDGLPADTAVVNLAPLETVSQRHWDAPPTWFKRLLDKGDLTLLQVLGVIDEPTNGHYFHGHIMGKSGLRPRFGHWLALHHVEDEKGRRVEPYRDPSLRLLHYESFSGEDFVRKWTAMLAAGPGVRHRPGRSATARALRTLVGKGLTEEQAAPYLMRIYERTTQDDFDTLRDLGLLEQVDPAHGTHQPRSLPSGARAEFEALLGRLAEEPKTAFHPGQSAAVAQATLERLTGRSLASRRVRAGSRFRLRS